MSTILWVWLGINAGFVLGAWWASRPLNVREGEAPNPSPSRSSSRTNLRRIS